MEEKEIINQTEGRNCTDMIGFNPIVDIEGHQECIQCGQRHESS